MKMTGREPPISISDGNLIMIGVVIMTVFVIVLILVMINDYRLYLGNHWKKNALQHTFQNDTLRAVWNGLGDVPHPDIILFAAILVERDLLTISPETVYLPDDDDRKLMLCRVGQHLLESLAVVVFTRFSPVNIFFDDGVSLGFCVHLSRAYLALYALFCLRMG